MEALGLGEGGDGGALSSRREPNIWLLASDLGGADTLTAVGAVVIVWSASAGSNARSPASSEVIVACTIKGRHELPPALSIRYAAFGDVQSFVDQRALHRR